MLDFLILVVIAVAGPALVVTSTVSVYNRRIGRVLRRLPADTWGAACVDPTYPRAWRALTTDGSGVHLLKSNGRPARSWSWQHIATVDIGTMRAGLTQRTGVILHLRDGSDVGLLMPSRNTLRYPRPLAERAVTELRRRQPAA